MLTKFKSPVFALIGSSFLWGVAGPIIKITLEYIPAFSFLTIRFLIASLFLYFLVPWKKHNYIKVLGFKSLIKIFLLGILGGSVNLGLYFLGISKTSAIEGTIIYSMGPIFVFLGGILFLKETVTKKEILGFLVTLIGFLIIILKPIFNNSSADVDKHLIGNIIMLFSALSWGLYAVLTKYLFNNDKNNKISSPIFITFFTSFAGTITLLPFGIYEILNKDMNLFIAAPGIIYMAIASSVVAFLLYSYGIKNIDVSHVSVFEFLIPAITLPIAVIFLNEKFSYLYIVGFIFLGSGLFITERVPKHIKHLKTIHKKIHQ